MKKPALYKARRQKRGGIRPSALTRLLSLRAPPLRFDSFDARHNKKCKHLKDVTVDFVFGKDDCFVPGL